MKKRSIKQVQQQQQQQQQQPRVMRVLCLNWGGGVILKTFSVVGSQM